MKILLTLLLLSATGAFTASAQPASSNPPPESPDEIKQKDAIIAQLTPAVMQPGDKAHGEQLFTQYCGICHKFQGVGKDFGPDLSLEGAFGPQKILQHIIDPNRSVNPDFYTTSVETQSGEEYDGVVIRDTKSGLTIHGMGGDTFVNASDVQSRKLTGRSLMPSGLESIGAEGIRDIITFICSAEPNFRIVDLHEAFNADSRKGLWTGESKNDESLRLKKFGLVKEGDIPFYIAHPLQWHADKNVILLKGSGLAKSLPQQIEISGIGLPAVRLHFLGGIENGANAVLAGDQKNPPVARAMIHFTDGQQEEILFKYGEEFGDWKDATPVSKARDASRLVKDGQLRWSSVPIGHKGVIQSITLSTFDNGITPAFVAITAETSAQ